MVIELLRITNRRHRLSISVTRVRRYYARTVVAGHWDAAMGDRRTCHSNMCQPVEETCRQRPPDGQEESTEQLFQHNYNNPPDIDPISGDPLFVVTWGPLGDPGIKLRYW